MNDWNIQSRAHACQNCGKSFADKEVFHTLLFDLKKDFTRLDICQACWESQFAEGGVERKGFISHWHGTYDAAPPPPPEAIQKETAESVLRQLIQANDPAHGPACFILAVMLERKRLLRVKEQFRQEGRRYFIYEQPKSGDLFTILDPDLQLDQLEEVQRDVASLLGQENSALIAGAVPAPVSTETSAENAPTAEPPPVVGEAANLPALSPEQT